MCQTVSWGVLLLVAIFINSCVSWRHVNHDHSNHNNPIVTISSGKVRGSILYTNRNESFLSFRGIPYGQVPIRFLQAEPVQSWDQDIFDATKDGPSCPEPYWNSTQVSEDCLRLNVYTKHCNSASRKPVIVYIHPGGFIGFNGRSDAFGPGYLLNRDVVLVTINYRLGSLGYLSTGTRKSPGNAGFKDQVLALRWIKQNIDKFGGDPDSVTLVGYSAGAMSATLHLVSPMSHGLFHKIVAMSCAGTTHWKFPSHQIDVAKLQARLLNITSEDPDEIVDLLRQIPYEQFMNTQKQMVDLKNGHPTYTFKPVVEEDFGQERFLTDDPIRLFTLGHFQKVPIITGLTQDEFLNGAYYLIHNMENRQYFNDYFEKFAPIYFLYERDTENSKRITRELRDNFFNITVRDDNIDEAVKSFGPLLSDAIIGFTVHRFVDLASRHTPVYYYKNTYQGRFSFFTLEGKPQGTVHHDDLLYLFTIPFISPVFGVNDPENVMVEKMTRMWTTFAKTGNPNNKADEYIKDVEWVPVEGRKFNYLEIGDAMTMKDGLFIERFNVWDRLFPLN